MSQKFEGGERRERNLERSTLQLTWLPVLSSFVSCLTKESKQEKEDESVGWDGTAGWGWERERRQRDRERLKRVSTVSHRPDGLDRKSVV